MIVEKNRKGISTFIATLLLMVLAVSAGVVIYAYTMGYLGGFGGPQTMGAISVDTWTLDPTLGGDPPAVSMSAYIRNIGKTAFKADQVYVNGLKITEAADVDGNGWWFAYVGSATTLGETEVGQLTITRGTETDGSDGYPFAASTTYDVKIIGADNTQLSFQVKK